MRFIGVKVWFFLLVIFLTGCSSRNSDEKIIGREKFALVIADLHMADATLAVAGLNVSKDTTEIELYYQAIMAKHGVTQKQIDNSFKHYAKKPRILEKIYDEVSENLAKQEENFEEQRKEIPLDDKPQKPKQN
jgi:DNA-binding NtrC family response regulator